MLFCYYREDLTCNLPRLECHQLNSDDESQDVGSILANTPDSNDTDEINEEYAITFDLPGKGYFSFLLIFLLYNYLIFLC